MRKPLISICLGILFSSCGQIALQKKAAEQARKEQDSILNAFKEIDRQLDSANKAYDSGNDTLLKNFDSSLRR